MAGTFTVVGTKTTLNFSYTALTIQIQGVVGAAAQYLFDKGYGNHGTPDAPILFASLANQQKLDIVDAYLRWAVIDLSKTQTINAAMQAAQTATDTSGLTLG